MTTRLTFKELADLVHQFEAQPRPQIYACIDGHLVPLADSDLTTEEMLGISDMNPSTLYDDRV